MNGKMKLWQRWMMFNVTAILVYFICHLVFSLMERRAEVTSVMYNHPVEIAQGEPRSDVYAVNYPREYNTWRMTANTDFRSEFNSSAMDDRIEERPYHLIMWAGSIYSYDCMSPRGHMHGPYDLALSLRTGAPGIEGGIDNQPSTCWTCKSSGVPQLMKELGTYGYYAGKFSDAPWRELLQNPVGCSDCHNPENNMELTLSRPVVIEAYQRRGEDIVATATHQQMRTLVCAQCHGECFPRSCSLEGKKNYLTYGWDYGFTCEDIEHFFDMYTTEDKCNGAPYYDFINPISKAPMLKAQHPDYELWQMGIHGQRGVSCADCHMPYISEGGVKFSDHHVTSPLANIERTCQVCHRESAETLKENVYERQRKVEEVRTRLEAELAAAHIEAGAAWKAGATQAEMAEILQDLRHSQWRWDFATASHGAAFHAPLEVLRIMSSGMDYAAAARLKTAKVLAKHGVYHVDIPVFANKAEARKYVEPYIAKKIGSYAKIEADKKKFMEEVRPTWVEAARSKGLLTLEGLE